MIKKYTYTKDSGEQSNRVLRVLNKPPAQNVQAIDLTDFEQEEAETFSNFYDQWVVKFEKPYQTRLYPFRFDNHTSFSEFMEENGYSVGIKTFKVKGLVEVL